MARVFLCRCEDVTLDDLLEAIQKGYRDLESLKRYTGLGTGFCQGKSCLAAAAEVYSRELGGAETLLLPTTPRPPLHPAPLGAFAAADEPENQEHVEEAPGE